MTHALFQKPTHTIGDLYDAVLSIHDGAEARDFYAGYVAWLEPQPERSRPAEEVARANIGWIFGEGMPRQDVIMWAEACGASHPVFGDAILHTTPEQAFDAGVARGQGD